MFGYENINLINFVRHFIYVSSGFQKLCLFIMFSLFCILTLNEMYELNTRNIKITDVVSYIICMFIMLCMDLPNVYFSEEHIYIENTIFCVIKFPRFFIVISFLYRLYMGRKTTIDWLCFTIDNVMCYVNDSVKLFHTSLCKRISKYLRYFCGCQVTVIFKPIP